MPTDGDTPEEPSELAIDVVDYQGVRVTCETQRWNRKVEFNHPELAGMEGTVAEAISDPEVVLQDRDFGNRRHHLRRRPGRHYFVAVVEYTFGADAVHGRLVTAFIRTRLRANDDVLYVNVRR